jgi:hypothetical protein
VDDCDCQPLEVPDNEILVRAISYSVHVKKNGHLKWQAYKPTPGTDEISVMRLGCMTPTDCKRKAKELDNPPHKLYRGLAVLTAGAIRSNAMTVTDSREQFCGHAHISTGVPLRSNTDAEPIDPAESERLKVKAEELLRLSSYYQDRDASSDDWPQDIVLAPAGGPGPDDYSKTR